jgi:hypothetical protein
MHETQTWWLDAKSSSIALVIWGAAVLAYALWRSRGEATPDPIRESGPIL